VGFDDMAEAAHFSPSLTTVKHPLRELGIFAVKTLLAQIEGTAADHIENTTILQTDLVIRDSTSLPLSLIQGENKVCQTM
jgi:LacI family transcriptional regulator